MTSIRASVRRMRLEGGSPAASPASPSLVYMCASSVFTTHCPIYENRTLILTAGCVFDTGSLHLEEGGRQQMSSSWPVRQPSLSAAVGV